MIEGIEHFPAELDSVALSPFDILQHSHIPGIDPVAFEHIDGCRSEAVGSERRRFSRVVKGINVEHWGVHAVAIQVRVRVQISPADQVLGVIGSRVLGVVGSRESGVGS